MDRACLQILAQAKLNRVELPLNAGGFLRPLQAQDVTENYVHGLNDPQVNRFLVSAREQRQTNETVRAFVTDNERASDSILFGIHFDERLRGTTRLHDIDCVRGDASVGIALFDSSVWRRGLASAALQALASFAFGDLRLRQLNAGIESENVASQRAFARAGFVQQAARRHLNMSVQDWVLCVQPDQDVAPA
jgi:RimJ/RimL family protein N-acetyltransferase